MTELAALLALQERWPVAASMYVSTLDISLSAAPTDASMYVIGECDRHHPMMALRTLAKSLFIAQRERPDVVITTGSMPLALFSLICKMFGAKIIWIDSISQIDRISMSGRLVRPIADLFFVQWPELAQRYQNVHYAGELV